MSISVIPYFGTRLKKSHGLTLKCNVHQCDPHGVPMECYSQELALTGYQADAIILVPRPKCAVIGPQAEQQQGKIVQVNTAELYVRRANN